MITDTPLFITEKGTQYIFFLESLPSLCEYPYRIKSFEFLFKTL